jgi:hypothetical protein
MRTNLLNNASRTGYRWTCLIASICVGGLLTACGGTPGPEANTPAQTADVQQSAVSAKAAAPDGASASTPGPANVQGADPSSFTMNSSSDFKGFNPGLWNDHRSWYECDCGNDPHPLPRTMPWNGEG